MLYKLDDPTLEYSNWIQQAPAKVPDTPKRLTSINIDDPEQFSKISVFFQNNAATADFFLSQVVFPKEARSFPYKLATSGWDLIEDVQSGHPSTTGFSGTNDNRFLLPTSITQHGREEQLGTNALVLSYLLQPENNQYFCLVDESKQPLTATTFFKKLTTDHHDVRVLLDVGAQMLELGNEGLARHWLSLRSDVLAAIFFDVSDQLTVLTQKGVIEPLSSSSFRHRLDECVVYLDDAHTRGTDLKLPKNARAVVTLGPKVTKDRLVQGMFCRLFFVPCILTCDTGCMRMRKLGHGQTVIFCASLEVDRRIRQFSKASTPQVSHIIEWAIHETLSEIERYIPQWAQNGVDHAQRQKANVDYEISNDVEVLRSAWRRRESKTLEELYGRNPSASNNNLTDSAFQLASLKDRLDSFGISNLSHAGFGEEQEREVSQELEQEREIERPPRADPAEPSVHRDIVAFVETGIFNTSSSQFVPVIDTLQCTAGFPRPVWPSGLYMTRDFTRTISSIHPQHLLDFLRPIQWVVSARDNSNKPVFVVFSPHEVNELLSDIRRSPLTLHIFNARTIKWMRSRLDLSFYTIFGEKAHPFVKPPLELQAQLALVSGQVYLDSMDMYSGVERLLEIRRIDEDGYVHIRCNADLLDKFKDLVGSRRKGMRYRDTHVGKILQLRPLSDVDFRVIK